jgi:tRNA(fMet)-specific endonuclease VapC
MILLDTDHLTVLRYRDDPRCATLTARLQASADQRLATTVVSVEEQMRGWLAEIGRWRSVHKQVPAYERLAKLFDFFSDWEIVPFDVRAADEFEHLRKQRIRIGSQDLKIASVALVQKALLLSANSRDFRRVPELRVENWLD